MKTMLHYHTTSTVQRAVIGSLLLALALVPARAADRTWDGGGDTSLWGNAFNWAGNVTPVAGDSLFFIGTTRLGNTNNLANGTLFNGITFGTPGNPAGGFNLFGNLISMGAGITNNQVVTPQIVSLPMSLGATRTVNVVEDGSLLLGGVISGAGGLTKEGGGWLTLSGANTFTGPVTVNDGMVSISSDANLGAAPGATTAGSLVLDSGTLNVSADFTLDANRGIAVGDAGGGEGRIDTDDGDSLIYGGVIAGNGGAGGLTKGRFGDITLSGASTYTGPTAIKVGSINLDFTAGGTANIINPVSALQLGGENSDLGDQSFAAIVLDGADGEPNSQTFSSTSLDIGTSRIVANSGEGGSATLNLGALTHAPGGNVTILLPDDGAINTTSPNVNGILGGFAMVSNGDIDNGILAGIDYATVDGGGNISAFTGYTIHNGGTIASQGGAGVNFRIDNSTTGDLTLAAPDTGVIELNTLNLDQGPNGRGSPNEFSIVVGTNNTLRLGRFGGISRSDDYYDGGDTDLTWVLGTSAAGANGVQNEGTLTAGGADNTPGEIVFTMNNRNQSSGSLNVEVQITDNGTAPVTVVKSGRGSMKFRGHNTYSGGTYIMQGRFQLAGSEIGTGNPDGWGTGPVYIFPGAQAFPSGIGGGNPFTNEMFLSGFGTDQENTGAIRMGSGAEFAGTINLFGDTQLGGGGGGSASSGGAIISGKITGGFGLDIGARANVGGGHTVAILTNPDNDWTGGTRVVGRIGSTGNGRLVLGADEVIPNGFGFGSLTVGLDTGGGGSTKTFDLNGYNETVNGLFSGGDPSQVFVENNGTNSATLTVGDNNASSTFAGTLRDGIGLANTLGGGGTSPLALTKIGRGVLTLSGNNSHTGPTVVNEGVLEVVGSGNISSSSSIEVNADATLDVSGASFFSAFNPINVNGGTFGVSSASVGTVNLTNGRVRVSGLSTLTANLQATALNAGGATNRIDVASVGFIPGYPAQFPIIQHNGTFSGPFNFGLGEVPRADTVGFISNNTASVDLVLLDGPKPLTWTGSQNSNWDINTSVNWLAFGVTPIVFQNVDSVLFDDSSAVTTVNITDSVFPAAMIVDSAQNYTLQGSGSILGASSLVKQGTGTLIIANDGPNGFSGGVAISNGVVQVGNGGTGGSLPTGQVINEASLVFNRSDDLTQSLNISGFGTVTQNGSGVTTLGGSSTYSGLTTVSQGTLRANSGSAFGTVDIFTIDPGVQVDSGATLDVGGQNITAEPVVVSGSGVGGNGAIVNSGADQLNALLNVTLTGDTTFGGTTRWDIRGTGAQLSTGGNAYNLTKVGPNQVSLVGVAVDFGLGDIDVQEGLFAVETSTSLGNPANTLTVFAGAGLQFFNGTVAHDKSFVLNGTGTNITLNVPSGAANAIAGPVTLIGDVIINHGTSDDNLTLSGAIGGSGSLTKTGGSTLTLSDPSVGDLAYSGGTAISGGTLLLDGTVSGGGALSGAAGSTVSGRGGNSGPVMISGSLAPGRVGESATFNTGNLTLEDTAQLLLDIGTPDQALTVTSDRIAVSGSLTVNGVVDIGLTAGEIGNVTNGQTITLITYTTGSAPSAASFNLLPAPAGYTFSLVNPATTPNAVRITVDQAPQTLTWAGTDATNPTFWDTTTFNWLDASAASSDFSTGDRATFDDSSSTRTVTLIGDIEPESAVLNHSAGTPYTFTGAGRLTGEGGLTLGSGGGSLIVANSGDNDFTGPVDIQSGILQLGNGGASGNIGGGALNNNGALVLNRSDDALMVNNAIAGFGSITNTGTGVATLAGNNEDLTGAIVVENGTLKAANGSALGDAFASTTVESGATLDVGGQDLGIEPVIVSGIGVGGNGAINNTGGDQISALEDVTLAGNTTFGASDRWDIRQDDGIARLNTSGMAYNLIITPDSDEQFTLVGCEVDTALADVDLLSGTFGFETTTTGLGNPANTFTISQGARFSMHNSSVPLDKTIVVFGNDNRGDGQESIRANSGTDNTITGPGITINGWCHFGHGGGDHMTILTAISGSGNIKKTGGSGELRLHGTNTYTGDTFIDDGTLLLVGDGSILSSANIIIDGGEILDVTTRTDGTLTLNGSIGQTLKGDGDLQGILDATEAGAGIAPGVDEAGVDTDSLHVTGAVTMGAGTVTTMELNAPSGDLNDELTSDSSITYGGTLNAVNVGASLIPGQSFKLFTATSYAGAFNNIVPATPGPNLVWDTSQLTVDGTISVQGILINSPTVSGGSLNFTGTGGTPSATYHVLCSPDLSVPLASWTPVLTNTFDVNGNFSVSLPVGADPAAFYVIREP